MMWAAAGAGAAGVALFLYGLLHPRARLFGSVIWHGSRADPPRVALTFDDGPHPQGTPAVLAALAKRGVHATFFMIGENVERHPDIARQVVEAGHQVGNHSYTHSPWGLFGRKPYWSDQIRRTDEAIEAATGVRPAVFRPPMGFRHLHVCWAAAGAGHPLVTWSRRAFDGLKTTPEAVVQRLGPRAVAGDILTLHDGAPPGSDHDPLPTAQAVGPLVDALHTRGLEPVRLDELFERDPEGKTGAIP